MSRGYHGAQHRKPQTQEAREAEGPGARTERSMPSNEHSKNALDITLHVLHAEEPQEVKCNSTLEGLRKASCVGKGDSNHGEADQWLPDTTGDQRVECLQTVLPQVSDSPWLYVCSQQHPSQMAAQRFSKTRNPYGVHREQPLQTQGGK